MSVKLIHFSNGMSLFSTIEKCIFCWDSFPFFPVENLLEVLKVKVTQIKYISRNQLHSTDFLLSTFEFERQNIAGRCKQTGQEFVTFLDTVPAREN